MKLTLEITHPDKAESVLQFLQQLDFVRVTPSPETPTFSHERLYLACKRMAETNPFRNIQDPVAWQKAQRDEWE